MADPHMVEPLLAEAEGFTAADFPFDEELLSQLRDLDAAEAGGATPGYEEPVNDEDVYKMRELIREKPKDVIQVGWPANRKQVIWRVSTPTSPHICQLMMPKKLLVNALQSSNVFSCCTNAFYTTHNVQQRHLEQRTASDDSRLALLCFASCPTPFSGVSHHAAPDLGMVAPTAVVAGNATLQHGCRAACIVCVGRDAFHHRPPHCALCMHACSTLKRRE